MQEPKRVTSKRIQTAGTDQLREARGEIHDNFHTAEGLHRYSGPRRGLVDNGRRARAMSIELHRRGDTPTPCPHCLPDDVATGKRNV